MPDFSLTAPSAPPLVEVGKLVRDPAELPLWWAGIETVEVGEGGASTMWPAGYPDLPMAQHLSTDTITDAVIISCLVSDLEFRWRLVDLGDRLGIEAAVRVPEAEAHRLAFQRSIIEESLQRLARQAEERA